VVDLREDRRDVFAQKQSVPVGTVTDRGFHLQSAPEGGPNRYSRRYTFRYVVRYKLFGSKSFSLLAFERPIPVKKLSLPSRQGGRVGSNPTGRFSESLDEIELISDRLVG
jgi:hypothetical protein